MSIKAILDHCSPGDPNELFYLKKELAVGSFGTVYEAVENKTQTTVALKIIQLEDDESYEDIAVEIEILKRCNHPNIINFHGTWLKMKELFIAMELAAGGSLLSIYEDFPQDAAAPCTEAEISFVIHETLQGLTYLHSSYIIHRDLKAANILVTATGQVKLADFGVSAIVSPEKPNRGTLIGTPYWMAPEIITMDTSRPYNEKVDIWATGITAIELAEKNPPHDELAPMKALCVIPFDPPPKLKTPAAWSREFSDFVALCLKKNPKDRKPAKDLLAHPWIQNFRSCKDLSGLLGKHQKALNSSEEATKQMASSWQEFLNSQPNSNQASPRDVGGTAIINTINHNPENVVGTIKRLKGHNPYHGSSTNNVATVLNPSTGRPATVRMDNEGRALEEKKKNEKLFVKNQLKELRKMQQQHAKIIEKQQEKDQKERDSLAQQYQVKARSVQKSRSDTESKLKQQQEGQIQQLTREHQKENTELARSLDNNVKNRRKQFSEIQKQDAKKWQENQKLRRKQSGSFSSIFKKNSSEKQSDQIEKLRFQNELNAGKLKEEHAMQFDKLDRVLQKEKQQLNQIVSLQINNFKTLHQCRSDSLLLHQDIEKELSLALKKLSAEQQKRIHNLQNEQMNQRFKVQLDEANKYIRTQLKLRQKEFKDACKEKTREVDREEREEKKKAKAQSQNPKDVAEKFKQKRAMLKENLDQLEKEFQLESEEFIKEEESELREVQKRQYNGMLNQQELDKKRYFSELEKRERTQIESQQKEQLQLLKTSFDTLVKIFTNQAQQELELTKRHSEQLVQNQGARHKERMEQLLSAHEAMKKLYRELKIKDLPQQDFASEVEQLKRTLQGEANELQQSLAKRGESLVQAQKQVHTEIQDWYNTELKTLRQLHNQHKKAKLQSLKRQEQEMKSSLRVNKMDEDGQTALHVAANMGDFNRAYVLIGEDIDVNLQDKKGYTALHNACNSRNKHIVSLLLEQAGIEVDVRNESGSTALHYFCKKFTPDYYDETKEGLCKILLEKGAQADVANNSGETPLMNIAFSGNTALAELLLARGANIDSRTNKGDTPLLWAIKTNSEAMVEFFLSKGANPAAQGRGGATCLQVAQQFRNPVIVKMIQDALDGKFTPRGAASVPATLPAPILPNPEVDPHIALISSNNSAANSPVPRTRDPQVCAASPFSSAAPSPSPSQNASPHKPRHSHSRSSSNSNSNSNNNNNVGQGYPPSHLQSLPLPVIPQFDPSLLPSVSPPPEPPSLPVSDDEEEYDENDLGVPMYGNSTPTNLSWDDQDLSKKLPPNDEEEFTKHTIHLTQKNYQELLEQLKNADKEPDEEWDLVLSDDEEE